jgi:hypothetical protein
VADPPPPPLPAAAAGADQDALFARVQAQAAAATAAARDQHMAGLAGHVMPGAIMSLSANIYLKVLGNSCNRMYL